MLNIETLDWWHYIANPSEVGQISHFEKSPSGSNHPGHCSKLCRMMLWVISCIFREFWLGLIASPHHQRVYWLQIRGDFPRILSKISRGKINFKIITAIFTCPSPWANLPWVISPVIICSAPRSTWNIFTITITITVTISPSPSVHHHYRHHQSITINVTFTNNATIIIITWIHSGVSVRPDTGDLRFILNLITDTFCTNVPHFTVTLFPKTLDTKLRLQAHCVDGPANKLISSNWKFQNL